ncbi:MAG: CBS domain-containing protein [Candidatus Omnitrophica bacterium]|nr:CBS domain-containing protein [Candidatus Omnitrophota bacterium]
MKVKEIMKKPVTSLKPDENALEALKYLFQRRISGLPVIDEKGRLLGMFTEKEIISYILPSYLEQVGRFVYEVDPKAVMQKAQHLSGLKVKDIMRQHVATVEEDTSLCEAAHLMLTQKARRILVLDKNKSVLGIIAREDVLKALLGDCK